MKILSGIPKIDDVTMLFLGPEYPNSMLTTKKYMIMKINQLLTMRIITMMAILSIFRIERIYYIIDYFYQ